MRNQSSSRKLIIFLALPGVALAGSLWAQETRVATGAEVELVRQYSPKIQMTSEELLRNVREKSVETIQGKVKRVGKDLVIETQDGSVAIQNKESLSQYAERFQFAYEVTEGEDGSQVRASPQNLQAVEKWNSSSLGGKYEQLDKEYAQLDQRSQELIRSGAGKSELRDFSSQLDVTREELVKSYQNAAASGHDEDLQKLLDNFRGVQRTGKALYGLNRDDRYPPATYERIYSNSKGTVAILEQGQPVHCSGVLISRDLVLTNEHCTRNVFPNALRVRFNYEENLVGDELPARTFAVSEIPGFGLERGGLDFSVLRIARDQDGNLPGDIYPIQCMTTARVKRDDPLYLIGHPLGEPRTVHDNTFVYFPFSVTEIEFTELEMLVRIEFEDADDSAARLDEFRTSYQSREEDGFKFYENVSTRWRNHPTIGVDSDTFHGNSGSPAFHRRTHRIVGILFDGEEDVDDEWEVGWRAHEAVLPITKVIQKLDQNDSNWRSESGVCIHE